VPADFLSPKNCRQSSWQLAGSGGVGVISAAFGTSGVLVAAGYFDGTIDFGSGPVSRVDVNSDGFVATWDTSGTRIATRIIPGADFTFAGVTHQSADDFLLWGLFEKTIDVGTGPLISAGGVDLFLASWTP
jgi:hypothetical protein